MQTHHCEPEARGSDLILRAWQRISAMEASDRGSSDSPTSVIRFRGLRVSSRVRFPPCCSIACARARACGVRKATPRWVQARHARAAPRARRRTVLFLRIAIAPALAAMAQLCRGARVRAGRPAPGASSSTSAAAPAAGQVRLLVWRCCLPAHHLRRQPRP